MCPSLVPLMLEVDPAPDVVEVEPEMIVIVPSGLVHVSVGSVVVTVCWPMIKVAEKSPEFSKGALDTICPHAASTCGITSGEGVQPLGETKVFVMVAAKLPV